MNERMNESRSSEWRVSSSCLRWIWRTRMWTTWGTMRLRGMRCQLPHSLHSTLVSNLWVSMIHFFLRIRKERKKEGMQRGGGWDRLSKIREEREIKHGLCVLWFVLFGKVISHFFLLWNEWNKIDILFMCVLVIFFLCLVKLYLVLLLFLFVVYVFP